MNKAGALARALAVMGMAVMVAGVSACDDSGTSTGSSGQSGSIPRTPITNTSGTTTITGTPTATATAGQPYTFEPKVSTSSTAVSFAIDNLPSWAEFNSSTGVLSGTPTPQEVGKYSGITISVSDGLTTVALPAFSITVTLQNSDTVTLSWQAPTENSDGTPLMNLKGYKLHYGPASRSYSETVDIANPGLTTYVVQNLAAGDYYFALTAYNSAGIESELSGEVSTTVD